MEADEKGFWEDFSEDFNHGVESEGVCNGLVDCGGGTGCDGMREEEGWVGGWGGSAGWFWCMR